MQELKYDKMSALDEYCTRTDGPSPGHGWLAMCCLVSIFYTAVITTGLPIVLGVIGPFHTLAFWVGALVGLIIVDVLAWLSIYVCVRVCFSWKNTYAICFTLAASNAFVIIYIIELACLLAFD
jgi:hypothetical protein